MDTAALIEQIVARLQAVAGVEAIVLGGSRARGTHTPASDIDLGIYYQPAAALDVPALTRLASELDDSHRAGLMTEIGGWGPWINGGGWLTIKTLPVDLLYRDLAKVKRVVADCRDGRLELAYQPGHPHAFVSSIYLAEIALCQPLWDPHHSVAALKAQAQPYPPQLKRALITTFAWEADFSLKVAHKSVARGDVAYAAGCCFRCVACLAQTLFALNEQYWMNEKGAVALVATLPLCPADFKDRVEQAFRQLEADHAAITAAIETLSQLVVETNGLQPGRQLEPQDGYGSDCA
ncbi:MAG: nucleotidyltransferase domain-containing protein [Chloroflexota bacterium]|nr:nucleotidyltransferase domain-containing protein [Chloroflexota bacterium]